MSAPVDQLEATAARLRREFDESFAHAPSPRVSASLDFLVIGIGGQQVALPATSIATVRVDLSITALPSPLPSLLGIASIDGAIVAVHDLAKVLGHTGQSKPRWLALMRHYPIAYAFASFDKHVRAAADALVPAAEGADGTTLGDLIHIDGPRLTVVDCERISSHLAVAK